MSSAQSSTSSRAPLNRVLEQYEQALDKSDQDRQVLLDTLLARDEVESALQPTEPRSPDHVNRLIRLDERLRQQTANQPLSDLTNWRQTLHPSDTDWWWFLDQKAEERRKERGLPWVVLAGTFLLFTTTLAVEIIRRLWDGAPDIYSIFGTLFVLLITSSPLFTRGQELAQWTLQRISFLKPRFRAEAMAGMAGLAFAVVLIVWLLLPQLATWYNNRGLDALLAGDLTTAQRDFRRATAINPEQVVAYHNLADVYRRIGRPDEALAWYQEAIEQDLNFGPAYDGLSQLYNEQGKFELAEQVSLAGLQVQYTPEEKEIELVTRYGLLSNLGRAYFGQEKYELAQQALEAAIQLEADPKKVPREFRRALPHYYLAQVYEQQKRPNDAKQHWEDALRFLKKDNWADHEWLAIVNEKLKNR